MKEPRKISTGRSCSLCGQKRKGLKRCKGCGFTVCSYCSLEDFCVVCSEFTNVDY